MKKLFLFLAAMCCMAVSAGNTIVITYAPAGGLTKTLREGTHDLGENRGTITINGMDITFDHVDIGTEFGFQFMPSDLEAAYNLRVEFVGYNVIGAKSQSALDFYGNPTRIYLDGDALRVNAKDAAAIHANNGSIRSDIMELYARNESEDHYTIEMGAGQKLDITSDAVDYRRVILRNAFAANKALALSPEKYGLTLYDKGSSTLTHKVYATPNSQEALEDVYELTVGNIDLNKGNLPYVQNLVPGLKSGVVSIEKAANGYYNINLKDVEIAVEKSTSLFFGYDVNFRVNVEGDNHIESGRMFVNARTWNNHMRGHVQFAGVGNNAKLDVKTTSQYGQMVMCEGLLSFENLTTKMVAAPTDGPCNYSLIENVRLYDEGEEVDPDYHQFIVKKNAKLSLRQTYYTPEYGWSGLVRHFTNLGSGSDVYTGPLNAVFAEDYAPYYTFKSAGEKTTYVVFDTQSYETWVDGELVTPMNEDDVLGDGKVSYNMDNMILTLEDGTDLNYVSGGVVGLTGTNNTIDDVTTVALFIRDAENLTITGDLFTGSLVFNNSSVTIMNGVSELTSLPFFTGCHAVEYSEFDIDNGTLYGVKDGVKEKVVKLTIVKDEEPGDGDDDGDGDGDDDGDGDGDDDGDGDGDDEGDGDGDDEEGILNVNANTNVIKRIVNGQLVIQRDGKCFNAVGAEVK